MRDDLFGKLPVSQNNLVAGIVVAVKGCHNFREVGPNERFASSQDEIQQVIES